MPLTAVRQVRKMRGGAQAHLLQADDGHWYVVKFRNNPQHRRVLINELLAAALLDYLKVSAPETALLHITPAFLQSNLEVHLTLGARRIEVTPGWHFGSRYPGDPSRIAVYDFLPDALLAGVANLEDFRAILVFDKWTGNADGRQAVFHRAMVRSGEGGHQAFVARMIDHGYCLLYTSGGRGVAEARKKGHTACRTRHTYPGIKSGYGCIVLWFWCRVLTIVPPGGPSKCFIFTVWSS